MILSFSTAAMLCARATAARADVSGEAGDPQPLRRVLALLDYVAEDYAHAVGPGGEELSAQEHAEQVGFAQDAARELRADAGRDGEDLALRLDALGKQIEARAPPSQVAAEATALRQEIARRFKVSLLPAQAPVLARGAALYVQSCAACHGAQGHPNLALGLATRPPDFAAGPEVQELSPQRIFNAETYGVPNTQMPAFDAGLSDAERWDVAFYVLSLAHPEAAPGGLALARAALVPTGYRELSALSDAELGARLAAAGLPRGEQSVALAALRRGPFVEGPVNAEAQGLALARAGVQKALSFARKGDRDAARRALVAAYLDHFEPHEAVLRARDPGLVDQVESAFLALRAAIEAGTDARPGANRLDELLARADGRSAGGALVAFVAALAIALREGVEAALLVAAMLALLRKAGRARDTRAVHLGWVLALLAGAATWWGSGLLIARVSGAHRELFEGVLQLALAFLILSASHWLFAAMTSRHIVSLFFQRALAGASSAVVLGITFIAIFREMLEVVMFFRSLALESPGAGLAVLAGALAGVLALFVVVFAFQRLGRKLKPRPLLFVCGGILSALSVLMVGGGVRSLQVVGLLPLTVWGSFELPALGLYATREGLLAQGLVVLLLAASALWNGRGRHGARSSALA